ncbi:MAG: N-hydroxyarylamine O-acetyltransferase [Candidatus Azotimanducaceae bacterium]|jgi:N-hydroxyarylamine O-acetyltransferase
MEPSLAAYLERIQFDGSPTTNLETLRSLQRQHLLNTPYENLDVQLGRVVSRTWNDIFDKLVRRKRGGWCYEMNGLLGWALQQLSFDVTYLSGGAARSLRGDSALGNRLVILVKLEERLAAVFNLSDPDLSTLWPKLTATHAQMFPDEPKIL